MIVSAIPDEVGYDYVLTICCNGIVLGGNWAWLQIPLGYFYYIFCI